MNGGGPLLGMQALDNEEKTAEAVPLTHNAVVSVDRGGTWVEV